jgi:hypothetical protein
MRIRGLCIGAAWWMACVPVLGALAVDSCDGRWKLVAETEAAPLRLFDANGNLVRSFPATSLDDTVASRVASIDAVAVRKSFVVSFADMPQLWEISWDPAAPPIYDGLVHDFRMAEALAQPGFLGVRRTVLDEVLDVVSIDARGQVLAISRAPAEGMPGKPDQVQVINLDVRRRIGVQGADLRALRLERPCPCAACPGTTPGKAAGRPSREWPTRTGKG